MQLQLKECMPQMPIILRHTKPQRMWQEVAVSKHKVIQSFFLSPALILHNILHHMARIQFNTVEKYETIMERCDGFRLKSFNLLKNPFHVGDEIME